MAQNNKNDLNKNSYGQLKSYSNMLGILSLIWLGVNILVYMQSFYAGILVSIALIVYIIIVSVYYNVKKRTALKTMIDFASAYGSVENRILDELPFPFAILDRDGRVLWMDRKFIKLFPENEKIESAYVWDLFEGLMAESLPPSGIESDTHIKFGDREYLVNIRYACEDDTLKTFNLPDIKRSDLARLYTMSMFDQTDLNEYIRKYNDEVMVTGLLYLDNYDETLEDMEEVSRSIQAAIIDRKINQYFSATDGLVRKFEPDKYLIVMRNRSLEEMRRGKFSLLEEIKNLNNAEVTVTISMGIGVNHGSYLKNLEAARMSIDLALGRGGDQVVISDNESIRYFGGNTKSIEKNTRVKARVKAHALRECMSSADNIVIMGHQIVDVDSVGAAIGLYRAAKTLGKQAHIVIDSEYSAVHTIIEKFRSSAEYEHDMFVNCEEAAKKTGSGTLLIVVDTARPSYTEAPELLEKTSAVIVLDHHRQSTDIIRNPILSYIEPYASSACELVAEILQYFSDDMRLKNQEADAIYAGIVVDTDNFVQKTGVRTFEAAAYLRRCGADVTRVRKMFREDMDDYMAKQMAVNNVKIFRNMFAISACPGAFGERPTYVAAQAANQLLNINGVRASFVLTEYNNTIYISARSIDEVNVQLIMERMGGGGHMNMAGCQLKESTIKEAADKLRFVITEMLDGGEL